MKTDPTAVAAKPRLPREKAAVPLPPGTLACAACGIGVKNPTRLEDVEVLGSQRMLQPGIVNVDYRSFGMRMTRCDACTETRARAEAIWKVHPRVVRPLGSPTYSINLIEAALNGLDALGVKPARADQFAKTDHDLQLLLKRMPSAGAGARWVNKFVSIMEWDASPETCSPARWSHVRDQQKQPLASAYLELLRLRVEVPVPIEAPEGGACLLCGIGVVMELPSKADSEGVWSGPWKAMPDTLGGRARPAPVHGYLCPACEPSAEEVGALGMTALEKALMAFMGVPHNPFGVTIPGIRAWVALPPGTPPNETPWAHQPDLDTLAEEVRRA